MRISVINFTRQTDEQIHTVIRAINRQIEGDFAPHWNRSAFVRLEGCGKPAEKLQRHELRGDCVIYLWDAASDVPTALGYHASHNLGLAYGFVFTEFSERLGEHWSVTLSHEVLELIADPNANLLAAGPHPEQPKKLAFHWY
jgi:hypothetical protein